MSHHPSPNPREPYSPAPALIITALVAPPHPSSPAAASVTPVERASYWDATSHRWRVTGGSYPILVGSSSRDIRLRGSAALSPG